MSFVFQDYTEPCHSFGHRMYYHYGHCNLCLSDNSQVIFLLMHMLYPLQWFIIVSVHEDQRECYMYLLFKLVGELLVAFQDVPFLSS